MVSLIVTLFSGMIVLGSSVYNNVVDFTKPEYSSGMNMLTHSATQPSVQPEIDHLIQELCVQNIRAPQLQSNIKQQSISTGEQQLHDPVSDDNEHPQVNFSHTGLETINEEENEEFDEEDIRNAELEKKNREANFIDFETEDCDFQEFLFNEKDPFELTNQSLADQTSPEPFENEDEIIDETVDVARIDVVPEVQDIEQLDWAEDGAKIFKTLDYAEATKNFDYRKRPAVNNNDIRKEDVEYKKKLFEKAEYTEEIKNITIKSDLENINNSCIGINIPALDKLFAEETPASAEKHVFYDRIPYGSEAPRKILLRDALFNYIKRNEADEARGVVTRRRDLFKYPRNERSMLEPDKYLQLYWGINNKRYQDELGNEVYNAEFQLQLLRMEFISNIDDYICFNKALEYWRYHNDPGFE